MPCEITTTVYTYDELLALHEQGKTTATAIEKAKQWLREAATCDEYWHEYVREMWKEALAQIGFNDAEIYFRGFWSQGDGACFESKSIDAEALLRFMASDTVSDHCIQPTERTGEKEDFWPWLIWKYLGGKTNQEGVSTQIAETADFQGNHRYEWLAEIADYLDVTIEKNHYGNHYSHSNTRYVEVTLRDTNARRNYPEDDTVYPLAQEFERDAERLRKRLSDAIYADLEAEYDYQTSDEAIAEMAAANNYTFTINGKREG